MTPNIASPEQSRQPRRSPLQTRVVRPQRSIAFVKHSFVPMDEPEVTHVRAIASLDEVFEPSPCVVLIRNWADLGFERIAAVTKVLSIQDVITERIFAHCAAAFLQLPWQIPSCLISCTEMRERAAELGRGVPPPRRLLVRRRQPPLRRRRGRGPRRHRPAVTTPARCDHLQTIGILVGRTSGKVLEARSASRGPSRFLSPEPIPPIARGGKISPVDIVSDYRSRRRARPFGQPAKVSGSAVTAPFGPAFMADSSRGISIHADAISGPGQLARRRCLVRIRAEWHPCGAPRRRHTRSRVLPVPCVDGLDHRSTAGSIRTPTAQLELRPLTSHSTTSVAGSRR